MVGLLISMLTILAASTLYRSTVKTVFGEQGLLKSAVQDGQLASGLMSAQMALQAAGYGISAPSAGSHLLLLKDASLSQDGKSLRGTPTAIGNVLQSGNALVWIYDDNPSPALSSPRCQALYSDAVSKAFYLLRSSTACEPLATQWGKIAWERHTLVEASVMQQAIGLSAQSGSNCWPFGGLPEAISTYSPPAASLSVQLSYAGSVPGSSNTYTSCLANFPA
ncbi:hypothetical protein HNP55_003614 [Paucibacter oligotrophus]|uniref:Uncharacterized protein n=1 Tax=Roseateles oligotrophus TaxID=1769250 RepID=A0A840LFS8_9BURK|nr:hypothetical protein [Roseateles oligotrophus]MBB4845068.1 hypothetical protein [Roseateles oligotrophus]